MENATGARAAQPKQEFAAITLAGIEHNSHWVNSKDGACEEIINLRYKDGSWHKVGTKKIAWTYTHGCDLIHYHPLNETESSTGEDTEFFYIGAIDKSGENQSFSYTSIQPTPLNRINLVQEHGFGPIGSIVECTYTQGTGPVPGLTNGMRLLMKVINTHTLETVGTEIYSTGSGSSHNLTVSNGSLIAFLPDDDYAITILQIEPGETIASINHLNNVLIVNTDLHSYFLFWDYDAKEYKTLEHPRLPIMSANYKQAGSEFNALINSDNTDGDFDYDDHFSKTLDFINNSRKSHNAVESYVMICVAYRLFDGSFMMHSQPLLTYIGKQQASKSYYVTSQAGSEYGYKTIYAGKPNLIVMAPNDLQAVLENWKDIITGLTIFMTKPASFYSYPQSRAGYDWKLNTSEGYTLDDPPIALNNLWYMPQSEAIETLLEDPVYYRIKEIPFEKLLTTETQEIELGFNPDAINKDFTYYMPVDSFSHHRLLSEIQYIFNRRLHQGNIKTIFGDSDTQLYVDSFFERTAQGEGYEKTLAKYAMPNFQFYSEVSIRTDSGVRYVVNPIDYNKTYLYWAESLGYDPGGEGREGSTSGSWSISGSGGPIQGAGPLDTLGDPYYVLPIMPVVSYPDPRAFKLRILLKDLNTGKYYRLFEENELILKAHPFMTMAYYANYIKILNEWTNDSGDQFWEDPEYYGYEHKLIYVSVNAPTLLHETTLATDNRYFMDENRLQVTRIDNPFVGEAKHSYQVGGQDSKILGLATSSVQVSDGQFGEFPLFIFTNEGVYTLKQGNDPSILYSSISPISKERLIPGTICEIGAGIIYCTNDGVKLMSGTSIKNISASILLNSDNMTLTNPDYRDLINGEGRAVVDLAGYLDAADFKRYVSGGKIAFDSYESEIIVCNPSYAYSYIYNLKYDVWFKISRVWDYFMQIHPKYYGVKEDSLEDLETENLNEDTAFLIHTKPIKLGSQGFKSLSRVVIRQELLSGTGEQSTSSSGGQVPAGEQEIEGVYLWGSGNGTEWKLIRGVNVIMSAKSITRVVMPMSNTSLRYMFLLIVGKTWDYKFSHLEISYYHKMQNKLR